MAEPTIKLPVKSDQENMDKLNAIVEGTMESSGEVVTIACKVPMGMILRCCRKTMMDRKMHDGSTKAVPEYHPFGKEYRVYGPSHPQNAGPHCTIIGDYALTPNIPKEFYDLWYSQHRNDAMVVSRAIFANSSNKINGESKEYAKVKSGLERLDPTKLPKKLTPNKDAMDANTYNQMMSGIKSSE